MNERQLINAYFYDTLRSPRKAWMREDTYLWHLNFADSMANTSPKFARVQTLGYTHLDLANCLTRKCKGSNDWSNGPTKGQINYV